MDARGLWGLSASMLALLLAGEVHAQAFPVKPLRFVVGLAPGGGTDVVARMMAQRISPVIGQQILVENRPGASGNIAAEIVAKAPADGYTLLVSTASHVINPSLFSRLNYDPIKDFAAITQLTSQPYIVVVNPRVPARSIKELAALAKSRKGGITYASSGAGLLGHLGMELLMMQAGFKATHVPYKGASPALMDTIGGHVDVFLPTIISGMPQARSGKVRAIGVTTAARTPALPDVPTVAEQGFPGYEVSGWYGLLAPAGTPREVIQTLYRAVTKVLQSSEAREWLVGEGAEGVGSTPEQFTAYMQAEMTKWSKVVRESGVRAD